MSHCQHLEIQSSPMNSLASNIGDTNLISCQIEMGGWLISARCGKKPNFFVTDL